ncbi:MAG: hypothetical protein RI917_181, partial [Actinomycetota bacterium]
YLNPGILGPASERVEDQVSLLTVVASLSELLFDDW